MARKTVADLEQGVQAILTGIDLNEVLDLYGSFERAVATFIQKADVPETMIRQPIMLYSGVTYYTPDSRMFGTAVIDIRPQAVNTWAGQVYKRPISDFKQLTRRLPYGYTVTFEYHDGDPIMGIIQGKTVPQINISSMSDVTGWQVSVDASDLAQDNTVYYQAPASLRFNLASDGTQGVLATTLDNAIDLSSYAGVGVAFLAAYYPDADLIDSVELRLGSDASNYVSVTATEGFLGAFYSNDFNQLIAFDWANATTVGSPDLTNIVYVDILTNYTTGTQLNNVRYGGLWMSLPSPHEILFYSAAAFREEDSGPFSVNISTDGQGDENEIVFRDSAYNIYVQEAAREVAKNQGAIAGSGIIAEIDLVLEGGGNKLGLYDEYRGDNPSEELRTVGNWYDEGYSSGTGSAQT